MASLNKIQLIGNLGADPSLRYMPDQTPTTTIRLATTDAWQDKSSGQKKEKTEWHFVVFFGRLAEIVHEYLKKGSSIYVEGKIRTRKWTDKDQKDHYTTEIIAQNLQMLGRKPSDTGHSTVNDQASQDAPIPPEPAASDLPPDDDGTPW